VSTSDTQALIVRAVERFGEEVPALRNLKLAFRLELLAHGDVPVWRVELPGPKVTKEIPRDARLEVCVSRPEFNELAAKGTLRDWVDAYERGHVKVSGDASVTKLIGNVIERQAARAR
jgi:hypothetical protein